MKDLLGAHDVCEVVEKCFTIPKNEKYFNCSVKGEFERSKKEKELSKVSHFSIIRWRCFWKDC